jgi:DNA segregation ATPase FtsK/SpoIIIE-like protein
VDEVAPARAEVRSRQDAPDLLPPPILLADSAERLSELLEGEIGPRLEQLQRLEEQTSANTEEVTVGAPRLVLFVDDWSPPSVAARHPLMREVMDRGHRLGVTVVCLADSPDREPSEADVRVVLSAAGTATVEERRREGRRWEGVWPDAGDVGLSEALARALAPLRLEDRDGGRGVADEVRALDLFGFSTPDEVDPRETWRPLPRRAQLRVPIGVSSSGERVVLDLKQAAEGGLGPHGLIVGATGSGKSELMRTLVSGLEAADQIVLISDAEPSTASLVAEAGQLLKRAGPPMYLVVNKLPRKGGRLDLETLSRAVPDARAMITVSSNPDTASELAAGEYSWDRAPDEWNRSLRELAAVMVVDWPELGLAT